MINMAVFALETLYETFQLGIVQVQPILSYKSNIFCENPRDFSKKQSIIQRFCRFFLTRRFSVEMSKLRNIDGVNRYIEA